MAKIITAANKAHEARAACHAEMHGLKATADKEQAAFEVCPSACLHAHVHSG